MAGFSVIDAALEGVRLTREKPRTVLLWGAYYIAFLIVLEFIAYYTLGGQSTQLLATMRTPPTEPAALQRLINTVLPFMLAAGAVGLLFQAMLTAAIYRHILRPGEPRSGLRFGMDELRLLAVFGVLLLVLVAMVFVVQMAVLTTAGLPDTAPSVFFADLVVLASWCAGAAVLVRLSLSGAATIARKRLAIMDGWRLTQGQFWRLLVTYALATVLSLVVLFLMQVVLGAVFELLNHVPGMAVGGPGGGGPAALVASLVLVVLVSLIGTCFHVILLAPPASAYAALTGGAAEPA